MGFWGFSPRDAWAMTPWEFFQILEVKAGPEMVGSLTKEEYETLLEVCEV